MDQDIEEFKALTSTLSAFYNYHKYEYAQLIKPRRIKLGSLSEEELALIPWYQEHLNHLKMCIDINEEFSKNLAVTISRDWGVSSNPSDWESCTESDFDKVRSTMLQLAREWSSEGEKERSISYKKILEEIVALFPQNRNEIKVLVPGCGLGRLVLELVNAGFWCQGNEFSYHMLLASNFILNHSTLAHGFSIFPYLHKSSNLAKRINQIRPVTIPDFSPSDIYQHSSANSQSDDLMSMTAGSFIDLYGPSDLVPSDTYSIDAAANEFRNNNKEFFDVLVSCFFIDTASNIIEYLKTIYNCLKPGGYWINFGPLLWHFEDNYNTTHIKKQMKSGGKVESVPTIMKGLELSKEDLINLIKKIGFVFQKIESGIETTYCSDSKALGAFIYNCEYWVCVKPKEIPIT